MRIYVNSGEFKKVMYKANEKKVTLCGGIVFSQDSFNKEYSEKSRTYLFTSESKAFNVNANGSSIFADCEDGSDNGVRIDLYMKEQGWKAEKHFITIEDVVTKEIARAIQKINNARDYDAVTYGNGEYVQVMDLDAPTHNPVYDELYWEGYAVKIGDEVSNEGFIPVYVLKWIVDNPNAEESCDTVNDWDKVNEVHQKGYFDIINGRFVG